MSNNALESLLLFTHYIKLLPTAEPSSKYEGVKLVM